MATICLILLVLQIYLSTQQCCLKTIPNSKKCTQCPAGTHLFRGSCIIDVENCVTYSDGFDCSVCKSGFTAKNGVCETGSGGSVTPSPSNGVQQTYGDVQKDDNLVILADYSRSTNKDLEDANVLFGLVRKYPNGTQHTVIQYQTKKLKYFQAVGQFQIAGSFSFQLLYVKQLPSKPTKSNTGGDTNNGGNSGNNGTVNPPSNSTNDNTKIPSGISLMLGLSGGAYKSLSFEQRKTDKGYLLINQRSKQTNAAQLGSNPITLVAFYQLKGLNTEYLIYYESTDKKSVYELKAVYQGFRNRVIVTGFNRTPFR